jgi:hypothetical protein
MRRKLGLGKGAKVSRRFSFKRLKLPSDLFMRDCGKGMI